MIAHELRERPDIGRIFAGQVACQGDQRAGQDAVRIAPGDADPDLAHIDPEPDTPPPTGRGHAARTFPGTVIGAAAAFIDR
jgi:hypothetical protein